MREETTPQQTSCTANAPEELSAIVSTPQTRTTSIAGGYLTEVEPCEFGYYWHLYLGDDRINGGLEDQDWKAFQAARTYANSHRRDREKADERESER